MRKIQRLLLSAFLCISLISGFFVSSIPVYAVSLSDINAYFDVQRKFYQILDQTSDIQTTQEHQTSILNKMYDLLEQNGYSGSRSGEGLESSGNVTINSSGDIVLSVDLQNAIRQAVQYEIDNNYGYEYGYSFGTALFLSSFSSQSHYHAFLEFIEANDDKLIISTSRNCTGDFLVFDGEYIPNIEFVLSRKEYNSIYASIYQDWGLISQKYTRYEYDSSSNSYVVYLENQPQYGCYFSFDVSGHRPSSTSANYLIIDLNAQQYQIYKSASEMRAGSEGVQTYYTGNDFSTSNVSSTQTITDSMLNSSISYNNISDYVNNYYVTNTTYPSSQDVYNYINNYNGSGGDNGGGSGGDNGDSDDDNNFNWGFLGSIGDFIGGLLDALSGIVSGILSALTGIIDLFIGTENPETGQREGGLPNIVGNLIQYFLPFLPPEFLTLIELSLILGLVLGIIRLIRGH